MPNALNAAVQEATSAAVFYEYKGQKYELASHLPLLPYMKLANLGDDDADTMSVEGIAAMYELLRAIFKDDATFDRFSRAASRESGDKVFAICDEVIELVSSRPQSSSSDSVSGQQTSGKPSSKQSAKRGSQKNVTVELPDEDED